MQPMTAATTSTTTSCGEGMSCEVPERCIQFLVETPRGRTAVVPSQCIEGLSYDALVSHLVDLALMRDLEEQAAGGADLSSSSCSSTCSSSSSSISSLRDMQTEDVDVYVSPPKRMRKAINPRDVLLICQGRILERNNQNFREELLAAKVEQEQSNKYLSFRIRGRGGMVDRQNRVGSKFGGGGVSSAQQAERERKERLKKLALESIDLAKDPYLMRNHLGTYECKLCLTLHTNEANYLAHTQGKKHQQGLARRAHMEKLRQEQQQQNAGAGVTSTSSQQQVQVKPRKVRIGRPAYQVFKSRDADTNQRCLSFELQYPEIEQDLQPRHRFMSAFEQRVEAPPDRRFQYLLFAAEPYETVAFKIPNEPIDKGEDRFVTYWDVEDKKFTLTLYFVEGGNNEE